MKQKKYLYESTLFTSSINNFEWANEHNVYDSYSWLGCFRWFPMECICAAFNVLQGSEFEMMSVL